MDASPDAWGGGGAVSVVAMTRWTRWTMAHLVAGGGGAVMRTSRTSLKF